MHVIRRVSAPFTGTSALTFVRSLTTGNNNGGGGGSSNARGLPNDDYFATIHHISNIVRRDIYMERTLNKMHISKIVNSELVYRVLRSCCNCGVESFRFFNWARTNHPNYDPTTVEFEELLKILAQNRNWETMWKTTEVYNSLLFALCEGKNFQGAYALIRRMIRKGYLESALGLVKKMTKEGFVPDVGTFNCLAEALCNSGQVKGHPPNRPVYTMMMKMCGRAGRFVEAANYLVEMTELNLLPMPQSFDMVSDGLKNCGKHDLAKRIEQLEISLRGI